MLVNNVYCSKCFAKVLMEMTDEVVWLFSLLKDSSLGKSFFLCQHFMIINLLIDLIIDVSVPETDSTVSSFCVKCVKPCCNSDFTFYMHINRLH